VYEFLLLLHLLTMVIAFAGAWTYPRVGAYAAKSDDQTRAGLSGVMAATTVQMHLPALILSGLFGIGLISVGDGIEFSDAWISIAFLLWFALIGVFFGLVMPAHRKLVAGETGDPEKKLAMATGITHLLFLLMLIDMIWKPGV
jgi:uncharacterized membrane protein